VENLPTRLVDKVACRLYCDRIADCCNPMSVDGMSLVDEIALTFLCTSHITLGHFSYVIKLTLLEKKILNDN